ERRRGVGEWKSVEGLRERYGSLAFSHCRSEREKRHGRRIDQQAQRPRHVKASETRGARAVCCAALRCSRNRHFARVQRQTRVSNVSRSLSLKIVTIRRAPRASFGSVYG